MPPVEREIFELIFAAAKRCGVKVYLVGGIVRDCVLGREFCDKDLDLTVEGDGLSLARTCHSNLGGTLREFPEFLTAKIIAPKRCGLGEIDFASTRSERYAAPGSLPLVSAARLDEDLSRRDFSVNAMAVSIEDFMACMNRDGGKAELSRHVLDPLGGGADLEKKLIRALHEKSFLDDPTRIFRACRYAARLSSQFESRTERWLSAAVSSGALDTVSKYRILSELRKVFLETDLGGVIKFLAKYGVLKAALPLPDSCTDKLQEVFDVLGKIVPPGNERWRFDIALRLLTHFCAAANREAMLKDFAFSKKVTKLVLQDLRSLEEVGCNDIGALSDTALSLGAVLFQDREELLSEARRRGLW